MPINKTRSEVTSMRVAAAAGRVLHPSRERRVALEWLRKFSRFGEDGKDSCSRWDWDQQMATCLNAICRDAKIVAASALTQRPSATPAKGQR